MRSMCCFQEWRRNLPHFEEWKNKDGILEEKFWGTEEGIRYVGHLYDRIGEGGANGSDVGTYKGGKMEHL